ncbi:MAG: enoyl-CoA hydratase/isomerase family protein [Promethearchaeota archaeon]
MTETNNDQNSNLNIKIINDVLILEKDPQKQVATIYLNRPQKRNALNYAMFTALSEVFDIINNDNQIRVVVLRAKGSVFCSGIDTGLLSGTDKDAPKISFSPTQFRYTLKNILQPILTKMRHLEKPIISAVHGICHGSGWELVLASDFIIATKNASFQLPEAKLGIIADLGGSTRICRYTNPLFAKEILLAARRVSAQKCYEMHLINDMAEDEDDLNKKVNALVEELISSAPLAVAMGKRLIENIYNQPEYIGLEQESIVNSILFNTRDFNRGISSWLEKKRPKWRGN